MTTFLLCSFVQTIHVECWATLNMTVFFLLYMSKFFHMHPHVILAVWKQCASRPLCIFFGWKNFIHIPKKLSKKGQRKQYKTKRNKGKLCTVNNYIQ